MTMKFIYLFQSGIKDEIKDLTQPPLSFGTGVSSMKIGASAGKWQVFTEKGFQGTPKLLNPGIEYPTLHSMNITSPVLSLRKE